MLRRHHARFSVLFPMIAGLVACGGSVTSVDDGSSGGASGSSSGSSGTTSSGGSSSGGVSSGSSGSSGTSGGSTSSSGGISTTFDIDLCKGAPTHDPLAGVTPAPGLVAVDYMELRDQYEEYPGSPPQPARVVSKWGTPCASASDKPACESALANAKSSGWSVNSVGMEMPRERYLVSTIGNTLEFSTSESELLAFITPVDTAADAALLVTANEKFRIACGKPNARKTATGWEVRALTGHTCGKGSKIEEHVVAVTTSGTKYTTQTVLIEEGNPNCAFGRKPEGLCAKSRGYARDAVGKFFADAAYLEAASVFAFERLERELAALGAPAELIEAARSSRADEVRHARMTKKLAARFGATVAEPHVDASVAEKTRSAFEIALENAVEGCIRETYAAVVAHWQAQACNDRQIACIMHTIAEDETKHAALAWDVAAWLEPLLSADEREAIALARDEARRAMRQSLAADVDADVVAIAGMPSAGQAVALFDAMSAAA